MNDDGKVNMDSASPRLLRVVLTLVILLSTACAGRHAAVRLRVGDIVRSEVQGYAATILDGDRDPKTIRIAFDEACHKLARNDDKIWELLSGNDLHRSDLEHAMSLRWPRADLYLMAQIPLGDDDVEVDESLFGGVYVNYDLLKAAYSNDFVSVEQAKIRRNVALVNHRIQEIIYEFLHQLYTRDRLNREIIGNREMVRMAENGLALCRTLLSAGAGTPSGMVYWQGRIDAYQLRLETAQDSLKYQEKELLHRLGFPGAESLIIRNLPDWFSEGAIPGLTAGPSSFMRAWELRGDARAAELDLFVSAMAIEAAHRKGWPRPFFRVGVGNNDLMSSNDVVPAVVEAGVTMPLIDFGENKRKVRNAETLRNLKQKKIEALLREIHGNLELAALESSQIQYRLETANSRLQSLENLREETRGLVTTGHLDATEEIRLGVAVGEAQLKVEALTDDLKKVQLRQCALTSLPVRAGLRDSIADALLGSSHAEPAP